MATMIIKHQVNDYHKWKTVFDEMKKTRREYGWTGHEIYREDTNLNLVVVVNKMKTLEQAKAYGQSAALREAMQKSGVTGTPEIYYMRDEEKITY